MTSTVFEDITFNDLKRILTDLEKENIRLKKELHDQNQVFIRETTKIINYLPKGYVFNMVWEE
jgi:hypothetical protein